MSKRVKHIIYEESLYSVFARGNIWYAQFKDPNSKKYLTAKSLKLRLSDGFTRHHAEKEAAKLWKEGIVDTLLQRGKSRNSAYFTGYTQDFFAVNGPYHKNRISEGRSLKESTLDGYSSNLFLYIQPFFRDYLLKQITRKDILVFRTYLLIEKKLDPQSAKNVFKNLKAIIKYALQDELMTLDPTAGISISVPKPHKSIGSILTHEEVKKLWKTEWKDERVKFATQIALQTGGRRGEILALRWEDLDLSSKCKKVYIRRSWNPTFGFTGTKTGEERVAYLTDDLAQALCLYRENSPAQGDSDLLFASTIKGDKPIDTKRLDEIFYAALKNIGITEKNRIQRGLTFHSLRHRLVTTLHEKGVSPLIIRKVIGHSDDRIEYVYFHGNGEEIIPVIDGIA